MKTQSFIFNWRNQFLSTLSIESALHSCIDHVHVINSDENNFKPYWHNIGESAYFTSQFLKALELHDGESVFFHVQGDTSYSNWPQLIKDSGHYMSKYNAGIYYPKVKNVEWYDDKITTIESVEAPEPNIKVIANGDETVWFIHPKVINYLFNNKINECFVGNTTGWGWDIVLCAISYILGLPVIRDSNHHIDHPKATNYNKKTAFDEFDKLKLKLPSEIQWYIHHTITTGKRFLFKKYLNL